MHKTGQNRVLVEFYDSEHLENVVSLLYGEYSGVVYVYFGSANEPDERDRRELEQFISRRLGFFPRFRMVPEDSVECARKYLGKLFSGGDFLDFDITGGSSIFIAAAGALLAESKGKNMCIHEYDTATARRVFCSPVDASCRLRKKALDLSVGEVLALRSIDCLNGGESLALTDDGKLLRDEVFRLWEAVRGDMRAWNVFCTKGAETVPYQGGVTVKKRAGAQDRDACETVLRSLQKRGLCTGYEWDGGMVTYHLELRPKWYTLHQKAGNLLELLTYFALVESGPFTDCRTGVKMDWSAGRSDPMTDPYNEVDAVAVQGHIPWFVSCKNTDVEKEYLYEILTMTRHYGGAYAVPAVVTTMPCKAAVAVRAREMGVRIIDDIAQMTAKDFCRALSAAAQR